MIDHSPLDALCEFRAELDKVYIEKILDYQHISCLSPLVVVNNNKPTGTRKLRPLFIIKTDGYINASLIFRETLIQF